MATTERERVLEWDRALQEELRRDQEEYDEAEKAHLEAKARFEIAKKKLDRTRGQAGVAAHYARRWR